MSAGVGERQDILLARDGHVATLAIRRGTARNAMTTAMWRELRRCLEDLAGAPDVRVLVLTGEGDSFTSGSDIRELAELGPEGAETSFDEIEAALRALQELPAATVARIHGPALGAGLVLALACDIRVASRRAVLGMPVARLGITVSPTFAALLVRAAGAGAAADLLLTGRLLPAREAYRLGLVQYLVRPDDLEEVTAALARRIAGLAPASIRAAKRAIAAAAPPPEGGSWPHTDPVAFREGVQAFLERREPRF